jgi:hypothetical protein
MLHAPSTLNDEVLDDAIKAIGEHDGRLNDLEDAVAQIGHLKADKTAMAIMASTLQTLAEALKVLRVDAGKHCSPTTSRCLHE